VFVDPLHPNLLVWSEVDAITLRCGVVEIVKHTLDSITNAKKSLTFAISIALFCIQDPIFVHVSSRTSNTHKLFCILKIEVFM